jgi:hypothetical protein
MKLIDMMVILAVTVACVWGFVSLIYPKKTVAEPFSQDSDWGMQ